MFLGPRLTEAARRRLDGLLAGLARGAFVGVVSTYRVHLGDQAAAEAEAYALRRAREAGARAVVFRPGCVLSPHSRAARRLRRLAACYPLVPRRLRGCCIGGDELFAAIEDERRGCRPGRPRLYTLLGPNRPWRELLLERRAKGFGSACLTFLSAALACLLVGHLAAFALGLLARFRPAWRGCHVDTLRPRSFRELLALCNRYNHRHVKVVGYNNGVVHFGQRFPNKTVVSTVRLDRVRRAGPDIIRADAGATVRKALDFLAADEQTLFVVPNYSYVCLGTSFFVPIHGSAADFSCVAETITRAVLYDPAGERLIVAAAGEEAFREHVYNPGSGALLRLDLRVKPRSRYFLDRQEVDCPGGAELLKALRDDRATNVEVRKSSASGDRVQVCRYYNAPGEAASSLQELPRDSLGRLWDRLEENPVSSFVFHALVRNLAWHVELFFTPEEFLTFWETHRPLPLRKIQLRYVRRQEGLPHSPFRDHDCVAADMFLARKHRPEFEAYLKRTFAVIRANPGKHSM